MKRIKERDEEFISVLHRTLSTSSDYLLERMLRRQFTSEEDAESVVATVLGITITKRQLRRLVPSNDLDLHMIQALLALFRARDDRITAAYRDVNCDRNGYTPRRGAFFTHSTALWKLYSDVIPITDIISTLSINGTDIEAYDSVHIIGQRKEGEDGWVLVNLSLKDHLITVCDPQEPDDQALNVNMGRNLELTMDTLLAGERRWACSRPQFQHLVYPVSPLDSGVVCILILYFTILGCPVSIEGDDLLRHRSKLAYWMLSELPI